METRTYLKGLAHDLDKYIFDGMKEAFFTLWRVPEIHELIIGAIFNLIFFALLKHFGMKSKHIAIIAGILDLISAAAYFRI